MGGRRRRHTHELKSNWGDKAVRALPSSVVISNEPPSAHQWSALASYGDSSSLRERVTASQLLTARNGVQDCADALVELLDELRPLGLGRRC